MRTLILLPLLTAALFAEEARWLRYPAISPDASRIAFTHRGDLWLVPSVGGEARPLTSHVGHERRPVWSPDGKWIAFESDRHGNWDVFVMPAEGGAARRLTFHSSHDRVAAFTPDGERVFFSSARLDAPLVALGNARMPELYSIPVEGGRPFQEMTTPALEASVTPDGRYVWYEDLKAYENEWRKHHTSSHARDIWVFDRKEKKHLRVIENRGEDRDPVYVRGHGVFYLSEPEGGTLNVWLHAADVADTAVTRHAPHPVRFLSAAGDATLAYSCGGYLWTKPPKSEPRRLRVTLAHGARTNDTRVEVFKDGATEFAVSPNEEEVAFVVRGEVFVASIPHGTTKRVTDTPGQERSVSWAKDGRTIFFAAERNGTWNLHAVSLARKEETHFARATVLKERAVLVGDDEFTQPLASPDGKWLAYLHNRDELRVLPADGGAPKTLIAAQHNYSYADGDIGYSWSADSAYVVATFIPKGRWIDDIALVSVESPELFNVTLSGYGEHQPRISRDGSAVLFLSNRLGMRSHGSWGSESDVFALDLTRAAHDKARLSVEEFELLEKKKDDDEKNGDEKGAKRKKKEKDEPPEKTEVERPGLRERLRRLTLHSARIGGYDLSPDGETLVYFAEVGGTWDLWINEIRKKETKRLRKLGEDSGGEVRFDKDGDAVFVRTSKGAILRVEIQGDETKKIPYAAEMTIRVDAERAYIFEHAWRQLRRKFYDPKLHGVDWDELKGHYLGLLPHVGDNHEFAELLSEMLGELNASHTGARYRIPQEGADQTAALGLLFDPAHAGDGLRVVEVLQGGPCDRADATIAAGALLTHIDGTALTAATNHWPLLNRRAGKPMLLAYTLADGAKGEAVVKPVTQRDEGRLRYERWLRINRKTVHDLSGGRVGYVHVRGMNDASFRHLFQEALGRYAEAEALVVDTRWNGGGWLHDDLVQFFSGKRYAFFHPRNKARGYFGGEPGFRWVGPVAVVQNEGNYSDAHVFPYAFQKLGLGKLVGTRVAGTGTAVWWENQIDPSLVFGIPQVGMVTPEGKYLENLDLKPDVEVFNDPESRAKGIDNQLRTAVEVLLAQLK